MEINNEFRILRVNLSERTLQNEVLAENITRKYLGGWNVILDYMLREIPKGADPLSPDNVLVFASGVLTGTPIGCAGRNSAGAKSPLTGGCALTEAGGYFGSELRFAGYDGIVITGKSEFPVYLSIVEGVAELKDANHIWGLEVGDAHEQICKETGESRARTALIGPAGENQVPIACILNDLSHAYGRCGLGAVMGSKNLKGIAVRGSNRPQWFEPEKVQELARWFTNSWRTATPSSEFWAENGTLGFLGALSAAGSLPTRNFLEGSFEDADQITGEKLTEQYLVKTGTCYACSIRCKREVSMDTPYKVQKKYGGPEYETGAAFGSDCGISDLSTIVKANELCNAFGIDTISCGSTIAWAMECYEKGLLTDGDCDGLDLHFGNGDALLELINKIANNEGIGSALGYGSAGAAKILNLGHDLAMHVKGQDFPMHEPRAKHGLGLSYAVSPTGADHMHAIHDVAYLKPTQRMQQLGFLEGLPPLELSPQKVRLTVYEILLNTLFNNLVLCDAARQPYRLDVKQVIFALEAVTGWNMTAWELMKVAERSVTMARAFNLREGLTSDDDKLPKRCFEQLGKSPSSKAISSQELEEALSLYYEMLGWDGNQGVPTRGKLEELNIGWVWEELKK